MFSNLNHSIFQTEKNEECEYKGGEGEGGMPEGGSPIIVVERVARAVGEVGPHTELLERIVPHRFHPSRRPGWRFSGCGSAASRICAQARSWIRAGGCDDGAPCTRRWICQWSG